MFWPKEFFAKSFGFDREAQVIFALLQRGLAGSTHFVVLESSLLRLFSITYFKIPCITWNVFS